MDLRAYAMTVLAVITAMRPSDLSLCRRPSSFSADAHFHISTQPLKQQRTAATPDAGSPFSFCVPALPRDPLSPARLLSRYLSSVPAAEVLPFPSSTARPLFVSLSPRRAGGYTALSSDRVSNCVVSVLQRALPPAYASVPAYSLRGVVASAVLDLSRSRDLVLEVGRWSSWSTFQSYYRRVGRVCGGDWRAIRATDQASALARLILSVSSSSVPE